MTNVDLDDVLSSIRRLVIDAPPDNRVEPRRPVPRAERLVLTPALRVVDEAAAEPAVEADVMAAPLPLPVTPEPTLLQATEPSAPTGDEFPAARLARTIAELEAALGVGPSDWEPEAPVTKATAPEPAVAADEDLETPAFQSRRTPAPAEPPAVEPEVDWDEDLDPSPAPVAAEAPQPALQMDETVLRDLIATVLREELQGELGERITRNVRKLVRREIYRVLNNDDPV